jgi:hypothetical protein
MGLQEGGVMEKTPIIRGQLAELLDLLILILSKMSFDEQDKLIEEIKRRSE